MSHVASESKGVTWRQRARESRGVREQGSHVALRGAAAPAERKAPRRASRARLRRPVGRATAALSTLRCGHAPHVAVEHAGALRVPELLAEVVLALLHLDREPAGQGRSCCMRVGRLCSTQPHLEAISRGHLAIAAVATRLSSVYSRPASACGSRAARAHVRQRHNHVRRGSPCACVLRRAAMAAASRQQDARGLDDAARVKVLEVQYAIVTRGRGGRAARRRRRDAEGDARRGTSGQGREPRQHFCLWCDVGGGAALQRTSVHSFCSAGFRRATSRFCVPAFAPARNAAYQLVTCLFFVNWRIRDATIMAGVDVSKYDGQVFAMYPHPEGGGCVKCMLGAMTCCTYKYEWTFVVLDKDTIAGKNHTAAGCCMPSPCPCCFGWAMCLPPCRQYTIHARSPTDPSAWVANGTSVFQGGCCAALCNQGDTTFWMSENLDGAAAPFARRACAPTPAAERNGFAVPSRIKLGH